MVQGRILPAQTGQGYHRQSQGCTQIPRYPVMTEGVHAVWGQSEGPHPIHLRRKDLDDGGTGYCFPGQDQQTVVIRTQAQFIFGA